jgi:N-acetylglucosamine kinase-like BadF-type ATPase
VAVLDARGRTRRWRGRAVSPEDLPARLGALWRHLRLDRGSVGGLVVASRGIWTRSEQAALAARLRPLARRVRAMSDVEAAHHAAIGEAPGVLLLAGTGSIALGRAPDGRWHRAGGLGPLLGDEGSAFWIGREWLRHQRGSVARARRLARAPDAAARVATLAPQVLRRARGGDRLARAIVARAQAELADLLLRVALAVDRGGPIAVAWAGGLLGDRRFRAGVWRAARRRGLRIEVRAPAGTAAEAASRMARALGAQTRPSRRVGRPA